MRAAALALLMSVLSAGCTKNIGELCEKERECEFSCDFSQFSHRRFCTKSCSGDDECPDSVCFSGQCVNTCSQDDDCHEGSTCWGGYCAVACRNEDDCPVGTCSVAESVCE